MSVRYLDQDVSRGITKNAKGNCHAAWISVHTHVFSVQADALGQIRNCRTTSNRKDIPFDQNDRLVCYFGDERRLEGSAPADSSFTCTLARSRMGSVTTSQPTDPSFEHHTNTSTSQWNLTPEFPYDSALDAFSARLVIHHTWMHGLERLDTSLLRRLEC